MIDEELYLNEARYTPRGDSKSTRQRTAEAKASKTTATNTTPVVNDSNKTEEPKPEEKKEEKSVNDGKHPDSDEVRTPTEKRAEVKEQSSKNSINKQNLSLAQWVVDGCKILASSALNGITARHNDYMKVLDALTTKKEENAEEKKEENSEESKDENKEENGAPKA